MLKHYNTYIFLLPSYLRKRLGPMLSAYINLACMHYHTHEKVWLYFLIYAPNCGMPHLIWIWKSNLYHAFWQYVKHRRIIWLVQLQYTKTYIYNNRTYLISVRKLRRKHNMFWLDGVCIITAYISQLHERSTSFVVIFSTNSFNVNYLNYTPNSKLLVTCYKSWSLFKLKTNRCGGTTKAKILN